MKTVQFLSTAIFASALIFSCSSDDPLPVNEEEVITTMTITLRPSDGGDDVVLQTRDLDGDGPVGVAGVVVVAAVVVVGGEEEGGGAGGGRWRWAQD